MPSSLGFPTASIQDLVGKVLAYHRADKKLDQAMMAGRLEMSPANLSRIENGNGNITFEQFLYACQVLDLQPSDVMKTIEGVWRGFEQQGVRIEFTKAKQESTGESYLQLASSAWKEVMQPLLKRRYQSKTSWWKYNHLDDDTPAKTTR